jgi:hypothetical protein
MTIEQFLDLIPGSRDDETVRNQLNGLKLRPPYERGTISLNAIGTKYGSLPMFANLNQLSTEIFEGRITGIFASYNVPPWDNVNDMVAKVANSLDLPGAEKWKRTGASLRLTCRGFEIDVYAVTVVNACCSYVSLRDSTVDRRAQERRKEFFDKARKEFKP